MPDITSNLAAHWKLDDASGTSAADASGNGHTGTLVNGPSWTTGKIDGGLAFDGDNDRVTFTSPALANASFSFAAWFKRAATNGWPQFVIGVGSSGSTNNQAAIYITNGGAINFGFYANDLQSSGGLITNGVWHHVVGTYDYATGARRIYLDGVEIASQASGVSPFTGNTSSALAWSLADNWFPLNGALDEVRIYTRALSAEDVEALYEYTGAPTEATITAAFTEPNETLSATATHPVTGVAAFTEPNESLSAAAAVALVATAGFTEPNETLSSDVTVQWFANASFTEPNETLTSAAAVAVVATALSAAEPNETLSGAVGVLNTLAGAFTEPNETLSSDAETTVIRTITAAFTEPNETLAASAGVTVTGSLTATEPNESLSCAASVAIVAAADFTEPNETLSAAAGGATLIVGEFTEPNETLASETVVRVSAALVATEPNETLSASAVVAVSAALANAEPNETLSSAVGVALVLSLDATEPNEQISALVDTGVGFRRRGDRRINVGIGVGL